jgi:hypothetical protein
MGLQCVGVGPGCRRSGSLICAGVRAFAADDDPGTGRPVGQVEQVGDFGDPGTVAWLAVGVVGRCPGGLGYGQDGLLDVLVDGETQREPDPTVAECGGESVGGAGGVGAGQQAGCIGVAGPWPPWAAVHAEVDEREARYLFLNTCILLGLDALHRRQP